MALILVCCSGTRTVSRPRVGTGRLRGVWTVQTGRVAAPVTGSVEVMIDVPSGPVCARVHREGGRVVAVDFVNVPSWVVSTDVPVATLAAEGRLGVGTVLRHDSIVGSTFTAAVLDTADLDGVAPSLAGMAYRTGEHVFSIDPHDPLVPGFLLR